jgi:hydrogenase maturation protease
MSRTLVAGIGNIFLGDDGFGSVVARHLAQTPLPPDVEVADIGIRGVHLAYQLLDGYDTLVLVDAMPRGEDAGTVTVLETSLADHAAGNGPPVDPHGMGPDAVLRLLAGLAEPLGAAVRRILVVGCEPATVDDGIGLSDQVAAAVPTAVTTVLGLLAAPSGTDQQFDQITAGTAPREPECTR